MFSEERQTLLLYQLQRMELSAWTEIQFPIHSTDIDLMTHKPQHSAYRGTINIFTVKASS